MGEIFSAGLETLAERLQLGKGGRRIVRGWEKGERRPSGPVVVALAYMLEERRERSDIYPIRS